jgi:hypothetical protein
MLEPATVFTGSFLASHSLTAYRYSTYNFTQRHKENKLQRSTNFLAPLPLMLLCVKLYL